MKLILHLNKIPSKLFKAFYTSVSQILLAWYKLYCAICCFRLGLSWVAEVYPAKFQIVRATHVPNPAFLISIYRNKISRNSNTDKMCTKITADIFCFASSWTIKMNGTGIGALSHRKYKVGDEQRKHRIQNCEPIWRKTIDMNCVHLRDNKTDQIGRKFASSSVVRIGS